MPSITKTQYLRITLFFYTNLITHIGTFNLLATEPNTKTKSLTTSRITLITTIVISSLIFGYVGDKFKKKWIVTCGIASSLISNVINSIVRNYLCKIFMTIFQGIGHASFITLAPVVVSDLFWEHRTIMLGTFFIAAPVGNAVGYVIGDAIDSPWNFTVISILIFVPIPLLPLVIQEDRPVIDKEKFQNPKEFLTPTYGFCTVAFMCWYFLWEILLKLGVQFVLSGEKILPTWYKTFNCYTPYLFYLAIAFTGFFGVATGAVLSKKFRSLYPRIEPVICGCGLLVSSIMLFISTFIFKMDRGWFYMSLYLAMFGVNLVWSISYEMVLSVVPLNKRCLMWGVLLSLSFAFGGAGVYSITVLSDYFYDLLEGIEEGRRSYVSKQYGLMVAFFVGAIGGGLFLCAAKYIIEDKKLITK